MMRRIALAALFCAGLTTDLYGGAGSAGGVVLMIFPGAKSVAMGGAFSAISDDATSLYYNPAGLGNFKQKEILFIHAPWLQTLTNDAFYEYGAFVMPLKMGALGFSMTYLTVGEVQATDEDGQNLGFFRPYDVVVNGGYGFKLYSDLALGANAKVLHSFLVPEDILRKVLGIPGGGSATTFAFDAGAHWRTPLRFINLSAVLTNMGPGLKYTGSGVSDPLPTFLRLGTAITPVNSEYHKITFAGDLNKVVVGLFSDFSNQGVGYVLDDAWLHGGLEYTFSRLISLRMGYFYDKLGARYGMTFGGGITLSSFRLDIADDTNIYEFNRGGGDVKRNLRFALTYIMGGGQSADEGSE